MRRALVLPLLALAVAPRAAEADGPPRRAPTAQRAAPRRAPVVRTRGRVAIHPDWEKHPSTRYAALEAPACLEELARRGVAFTKVDRAPGVLAPVRLPEAVGGVVFRTAAPAHARATSPYDVFDCRLALALHDWAALLAAHDVDEVLLFSAWRPDSRVGEGLGRRHGGGLAIDAYRFRKRADAGGERVELDVLRDFHGTPGAPPCGAGAPAPRPDTIEARELRSIVCEAADQHLFTVMLTPHHDRHHRNHLHLEITPAVPWHLVR